MIAVIDNHRGAYGAAAEPALGGDFTCVATWEGNAHVAFVIDTVARRIVGWRVSRTDQVGFVHDDLEQALHDRRPAQGTGLVHHSDSGVQPELNWSSQHLFALTAAPHQELRPAFAS
jgi:transposase InsO family protein